MGKSNIAWTDFTFNPWMGCFKVSQGCKHCYAETLTMERLHVDVFGADLSKRRRTLPANWNKVRRWNRQAQSDGVPARVFCASLADVFEDAPGPNEWRSDVFDLVRETTWLDWLMLTKRPENIVRMLPDDWDDGYRNVWLGTSIEDNRVAERADILTAIPAFNHFVSYEPAIGPADEMNLEGIEWVILGGESGQGFRPMQFEWALDIRLRCELESIAFFAKQDAALRTETIGRLRGWQRDYPESWQRDARWNHFDLLRRAV